MASARWLTLPYCSTSRRTASAVNFRSAVTARSISARKPLLSTPRDTKLGAMRWVAALSLLAFHAAYAETLAGTVVSVIDGDTLVVQDAAKKRHVVRLADIDAPERKQPFFLESARSLASL